MRASLSKSGHLSPPSAYVVASICSRSNRWARAGRFLRDLNADTSADPCCACLDQSPGVRKAFDATGSLDAQLSSHGVSHQSDIRYGRAPFGESGRRLDEVGPGAFRGETSAHLLVIGQESRLDYDLADDVRFMSDFGDAAYILLDCTIVAALEGADVDNHINLASAIKNRTPRFVSLHIAKRCAEREADHCADWNARALQVARSRANPGRIYAHGGESEPRSFFAQVLDVVFGRLGLEERVIDQTGPIARRPCLSKHQANARRSGIDNPVYPLGATIETLVRTPTQLCLPVYVTIETRDNDIRYLLDEALELSVA
jgi:hypothetical protein